jgi:hypothetical protein
MAEPTPAQLASLRSSAWYLEQRGQLPCGIYRYICYCPVRELHALKHIPVKGIKPKPALLYRIAWLTDAQWEHALAAAAPIQLIEAAPRLKSTVVLPEDTSRDAVGRALGAAEILTLKEGGKRARALARRTRIMTQLAQPKTLRLLLDPAHRLMQLRAISKREKVHQDTVERDLERLLDHGVNVARAAVDGYGRCGRKAGGEYTKKQGRPRNLDDEAKAQWVGVNVTEQDRRNIREFLQSSYKPADSVADNYRDFKARFAIAQRQILTGAFVALKMRPDQEFMSESQFRYHIVKQRKELALALGAQRIKVVTAQEVATRLGSARDGVHAPGQRLLMDSTIADVYLVCEWDRTRIIGRPVIYVVIDAATSVIHAIHVTLRPPSAEQGKIALFLALTGQCAVLEDFGLGAYQALLPRACSPTELVWDRGEMHSKEGHAVAALLNAILSVPPPYKPEWKGIVERSFRILNQYVIHWLPGSTKGRLRERGERDHRLDSVLTLREFTRILLIGVLLWNLRGEPSVRLEPAQLADLPGAGPVDLYQWGLVNRHGSPSYLPYDELAVRLLTPMTTHIAGAGITIDNYRWVGNWMRDEQLAAQGILQQQAKVYRLPQAPGRALVHMAGEQHLREAMLPASFGVAQGSSWEDIEELMAVERQTKSLHQLQTQGFETAAHHTMREQIKTAKAETAAAHEAKPQSKAQRLGSIKANRTLSEALDAIAGQQAMKGESGGVHDADVADDASTRSESAPMVPGGSSFLEALRKKKASA